MLPYEDNSQDDDLMAQTQPTASSRPSTKMQGIIYRQPQIEGIALSGINIPSKKEIDALPSLEEWQSQQKSQQKINPAKGADALIGLASSTNNPIFDWYNNNKPTTNVSLSGLPENSGEELGQKFLQRIAQNETAIKQNNEQGLELTSELSKTYAPPQEQPQQDPEQQARTSSGLAATVGQSTDTWNTPENTQRLAEQEKSDVGTWLTGQVRSIIGNTEVGKTILSTAEKAGNIFNLDEYLQSPEYRAAVEKAGPTSGAGQVLSDLVGGGVRALAEFGITGKVLPELGAAATAPNIMAAQYVANNHKQIGSDPVAFAKGLVFAYTAGKVFDFIPEDANALARIAGMGGLNVGSDIISAEADQRQVSAGELGKSFVSGAAFGALGIRGTKELPSEITPEAFNETLNRAIEAIAGGESGNKYFHDDGSPIINTTTRTSTGEPQSAIGKYQQMDRYIPDRTEKYLGRRMTPGEFAYDPEAQEIVGQNHIADLLLDNMTKHGNTKRALIETFKDYYGRGKSPEGFPASDKYANQMWKRFRNSTGESVPDITAKPQNENQAPQEAAATQEENDPQEQAETPVSESPAEGDMAAQEAPTEQEGGQINETAREDIPIPVSDMGVDRGAEAETETPQLENSTFTNNQEGETNNAVTESQTGIVEKTDEQGSLEEHQGAIEGTETPGESRQVRTEESTPDRRSNSGAGGAPEEEITSLLERSPATNRKLALEVMANPTTPEQAALTWLAKGNSISPEGYSQHVMPKRGRYGQEYRDLYKNGFISKDGYTVDAAAHEIEEMYPEAFGHFGDENVEGGRSRDALIDALLTHSKKGTMYERLAETHPSVMEAKMYQDMAEAHAASGEGEIPDEAKEFFDFGQNPNAPQVSDLAYETMENYFDGNKYDWERYAKDLELAKTRPYNEFTQRTEFEPGDHELLSTEQEVKQLRTVQTGKVDEVPKEANDSQRDIRSVAEPQKETAEVTEPDTFSIKNSYADAQREELGLSPIEKTTRPTDVDAEKARELFKTGYGEALVDELAENPRAVQAHEQHLLSMELNDRAEKVQAANDALENEKTDAGKFTLQQTVDDAQERYDKTSRVANSVAGSETGRSLAARKAIFNKDDLSLAQMMQQKRIAKNWDKPVSESGGLTVAEQADVRRMFEEKEAAKQELENYKNGKSQQSAQENFDLILKLANERAADIAQAKKSKNYVKFFEDQASKGRAYLKSQEGTLSAYILPVDKLYAYAQIGSEYLAHGISDAADFSKKLVSEFGDKVRPLIDQIYSASKKNYEDGLLAKAGKKPGLSSDEILTNAKAKGEIGLESNLIFKLARAHVNEAISNGEEIKGTAGFQTIMERVHSDLAPHIEGISQREVNDAFSGYGKVRQPSKQEDLKTLREYRRIGQLTSAIEEAMSGKAPKKSGMQRDKPSADVRGLMKDLQQTIADAGIETSSPEEQLKTRLDAAKTRLQNQVEDITKEIKEYESRIAEGEKLAPRTSRNSRLELDAEGQALQAARDLAKDKRDKLYNEFVDTEAQSQLAGQKWLAQQKIAVARKTDELSAKIEAAKTDPSLYQKQPRIQHEPDAELEHLQANYKAKQQEFRYDVEKDRLVNRPWGEKAVDQALTMYRQGVVSSPVTFVRLLVSAAVREGYATPVEAIESGIIQSVFKQFGERTSRDQSLSEFFHDEAAAKGALAKYGFEDAWKNLHLDYSDLEKLYSEKGLHAPSKWEAVWMAHSAAKAPIVRAEFTRSYVQRMRRLEQRGYDVTKESLQKKVGAEAYQDALRSKFQQDNIVTKGYRQWLHSMQRSKDAPKFGQFAASVGRVLLPVLDVPTNMVAEASEYIHGLVSGSVKLRLAYGKGIETLQPKEADYINRLLVKGGHGAALLALGFVNYKAINKFEEEHKIFTHFAPFMAMKFGASVGEAFHAHKGLPEAAAGASLDLAQHVPFVSLMSSIGPAIRAGKEGGISSATNSYFGNLIKGFIPAAVQEVAKFTDKDSRGNVRKRKPKNFIQHIEMGIPGLRETISQ